MSLELKVAGMLPRGKAANKTDRGRAMFESNVWFLFESKAVVIEETRNMNQKYTRYLRGNMSEVQTLSLTAVCGTVNMGHVGPSPTITLLGIQAPLSLVQIAI